MKRPLEDFKKIEAALNRVSQLQLDKEDTIQKIDEAKSQYLQALSHATQINEHLLRSTLQS